MPLSQDTKELRDDVRKQLQNIAHGKPLGAGLARPTHNERLKAAGILLNDIQMEDISS